MLDLFIAALVAITVFVWWQATRPMPRDAPKQRKATHHTKETGVCIRVIDGDTIEVAVDGRVEKVRYIGVNAPEHGQAGFHAAAEANRRLVDGKTVTLERDRTDRDKYGRLLRYVWVNEKFVNRELVRSGKAKVMAIAPNTSRIIEISQ